MSINPQFSAFLDLPANQRLNEYRIAADKIGTLPEHIEKDLWTCHVLDALFNADASGSPRLLELDKKFGLKSRVIVETANESSSPALLSESGFHLSYYLPTEETLAAIGPEFVVSGAGGSVSCATHRINSTAMYRRIDIRQALSCPPKNNLPEGRISFHRTSVSGHPGKIQWR